MKEIHLTRGYVAKVDDEDFAWLSLHLWRASVKPDGLVYAARTCRKTGRSVHIEMHRAVMGFPSGKMVDHKNLNTMDNRKENLRLATDSLNQANQGPKNGKKFKGIWLRGTKWRAGIKLNGKKIHLGYFSDPEQAARAYDAKAREIFGDFALTNFTD